MPHTQNPVDLDLISDVNLILSNNEPVYGRVREAAAESVREDAAALNDKDAYALAYNNGNSDWETLCEAAAVYVVEAVLDFIEETVSEGFVYDMITQRLDLGNNQVWACITEGFMPDPDNV